MVVIVLFFVFFKIVIGMGIIIVIRLMEVRCVIVIGMEFSVLFFVFFKIIWMGIISVIREMVVRFVWIIGMELSVNIFVR